MAIYHFSAQAISRGKGKNTISASAYRSGEKIKDEQTNKIYDYRKKEVAEKFILAPSHAPEWVSDRKKLWNEVEKKETRKNSRLAREINVALPKELDEFFQTELLKDYVQENFVSRGMVADVCIHRNDKNNPHAHIMLTTREMDSDGFTTKNRNWDKRETLEEWRENWGNTINKYLELEGIEKRVDHRSYKKQGIEKIPQKHEGHKVTALKRKGKLTDRAKENQIIRAKNQLQQSQKEIAVTTDLPKRSNLNDMTQSIPKPTQEPKNQKQTQNKPNFAQEKANLIKQSQELHEKKIFFESELNKHKNNKEKIEKLLKEPTYNLSEIGRLIERNNDLKPSNFIESILYYFDKDKQKEVLKNTKRIEKLQERNDLIEKEKPNLKQDLRKIKNNITAYSDKLDRTAKEYSQTLQKKKELQRQQSLGTTKTQEIKKGKSLGR